MNNRINILFISLIIFAPIFLGLVFIFSTQFNMLDSSTKLISYLISISLIELILIFTFLHSKKRIKNTPGLKILNIKPTGQKKYIWIYILLLIAIPTLIFYLSSYQKNVYDISTLIIPPIAGAYIIIKKPISSGGVFTRKSERILGLGMLIIGILMIIMEFLG